MTGIELAARLGAERERAEVFRDAQRTRKAAEAWDRHRQRIDGLLLDVEHGKLDGIPEALAESLAILGEELALMPRVYRRARRTEP